MRKRVTIDRTRWRRGTKSWFTNPDGTMCAMGFAFDQVLHRPEEPMSLDDKADGEDAFRVARKVYATLQDADGHSEVAARLYQRIVSVNDDPTLTDPQREERLKEVFKLADIDLEFVTSVETEAATQKLVHKTHRFADTVSRWGKQPRPALKAFVSRWLKEPHGS